MESVLERDHAGVRRERPVPIVAACHDAPGGRRPIIATRPCSGTIPAISIIRDPRDVMVSRYHLIRDKRDEIAEPFDRFIRDRPPRPGELVQALLVVAAALDASCCDTRTCWPIPIGNSAASSAPSASSCRDEHARTRRSFGRASEACSRQRNDGSHRVPQDGLFFRSGSSGPWRERFE